MKQLPVRKVMVGVLLPGVALFVGALGWNHGARARQVPITPVQTRPVQTSKPESVSQPAAQPGPGITHLVRAGETLASISRTYQISVSAIRSANGLQSDLIRDGQKLQIPAAAPVTRHTVTQGDTLWTVASRYGVTMENLLQANRGFDDPGHLQIGQVLLIPARSASLPTTASSQDEAPVLALVGLFKWPNNARISSYFGPRDGRNHAGIDIAANQGDPIAAARDGEVYLAGTVPGYGNTVIVKHPDGTRTLYAHSSKLLVRPGQKVKQGETVALVGSTGHSTGPHLHFEIIVNDRPRNPLLYLPKR